MNTEVLFQITTDKLETGLRGFPVGYCPTSTVDPQKGLFYMGLPITKLASWSPESVIYLLTHGKEGSPAEIQSYFLKVQGALKKETMDAIDHLPRKGHAMALFSAALLIAGMFEAKGDYRTDCEKLIATIPQIAAAVINHHAGWGKTPTSNPTLGYMENFVHMLNIPEKKTEELTRAFRLFNILHYDHGGGNLSTFVGKAVASGLEDMYGSIASAMCALAGPRHGRANQDCLEFLRNVLEKVGKNATASQVEELIRKRLANKELVFGFGHAVLRVEDPRATIVYRYLQEHYPDSPLVKVALLLRTEGAKVLEENPKVSNPHPNIDAISGTLLALAGFDFPEYFTVIFGLSRIVGIAQQIVYERLVARGGKGLPIIRPKYLYSGPKIKIGD